MPIVEVSVILLMVVIFLIALSIGFYVGRNLGQQKGNKKGPGESGRLFNGKQTKTLPETGYSKGKEVFRSLFSTLIEIEKKDVDEIYSVLASFAVNNTCGDYAAMIIKEGNHFIIKGSAGLSTSHLEKIKSIKYDGFERWFEEKNVPIISLEKQGDFKLDSIKRIDDNFKDISLYPLFPKNELIGMMLVMTRRKGREFTEVDEYILSNICGILAFYIHNLNLNMELRETTINTTKAIANALEERDKYTRGHSERVKELSLELAYRLKLDVSRGNKFIQNLELSGSLHDLGKIGIPDSILNKPGKLDDEEFGKIKAHPEIAVRMLEPLVFLKEALPGILHHHEKFDGTGYPRGLKKDEIPVAARLISIADVYDALTTKRPYRDAFSKKVAMDMMTEMKNKNFDPEILEEFLSMISKKDSIQKEEVRNESGT